MAIAQDVIRKHTELKNEIRKNEIFDGKSPYHQQYVYPGFEANKKGFYARVVRNVISLLPEITYFLFLYLSARQGIEGSSAALFQNELLSSSHDFSTYRNDHPDVAFASAILAGGTAFLDFINNLLLVMDPIVTIAHEAQQTRHSKTLYEAFYQQQHPGELPESNLQPEEKKEKPLNLPAQIAVWSLFIIPPFLIGAGGNFSFLAAPASESPSLLQSFVADIQTHSAAKWGVSSAILICSLIYYHLVMEKNIIAGAKTVRDWKFFNKNNLCGSIDSLVQLVAGSVIRGAGFAFILGLILLSPKFANLSNDNKLWSYLFGFTTATLSTFLSRVTSSSEKYIGEQDELDAIQKTPLQVITITRQLGTLIPACDQAKNYLALARERINTGEASFTQRNWHIVVASTYAVAFGVMLALELDARVAALGKGPSDHFSYGNMLGIVTGVVLLIAKSCQGKKSYETRLARAIYHEHQYFSLLQQCETQFPSINDAENPQQLNKEKCDAYDVLRQQCEHHRNLALTLGSTRVEAAHSSAAAVVINSAAIAARYCASVLFGTSFLTTLIPGLQPNAAAAFMLAFALESALSGLLFNAPKTLEGMQFTAKKFKSIFANCCDTAPTFGQTSSGYRRL